MQPGHIASWEFQPGVILDRAVSRFIGWIMTRLAARPHSSISLVEPARLSAGCLQSELNFSGKFCNSIVYANGSLVLKVDHWLIP